MNKYEHKMARGTSLNKLSQSMTEVANIRNKEIDDALDMGLDVTSFPNEWFKPIGELTFINGEYLQVMRRII